MIKPFLKCGLCLPPLRGSGNDAPADYEANRWGDHFEMIRDANGDWGTVVYDATDPRRATFYRAASQSSVFNPVTRGAKGQGAKGQSTF